MQEAIYFIDKNKPMDLLTAVFLNKRYFDYHSKMIYYFNL